jgi:hypothetical protein
MKRMGSAGGEARTSPMRGRISGKKSPIGTRFPPQVRGRGDFSSRVMATRNDMYLARRVEQVRVHPSDPGARESLQIDQVHHVLVGRHRQLRKTYLWILRQAARHLPDQDSDHDQYHPEQQALRERGIQAEPPSAHFSDRLVPSPSHLPPKGGTYRASNGGERN